MADPEDQDVITLTPIGELYVYRDLEKNENLLRKRKLLDGVICNRKRKLEPNGKNGRKKLKLSKLSYICVYDTLPYDNDALPTVRFPLDYSVPLHLLQEFSVLFPPSEEKKKRGGKCSLVPPMLLEGREAEFMQSQWMRRHWTPENLNMLIKVILKKEGFTLSMLDWLCIGYAKELDIHYTLKDQSTDFYIHDEYEQNLRVFKRGCFDFFSRNQRLLIEYEDTSYNTDNPLDITDCIETGPPGDLQIHWDSKEIVGVRLVPSKTAPKGFKKMIYLITGAGQLICFQWAYTHQVVEYCKQHADLIKPNMKAAKKKNQENQHRRKPLCEAAPKKWTVKKVQVTLKYDMVNAIIASNAEKNKEEKKIEEFVWVDPIQESNQVDENSEEFVWVDPIQEL